MKISSKKIEETKLNQQNLTSLKTGDTKFENGLKELNKTQETSVLLEEKQTAQIPVETKKVDDKFNLNETPYVYVAKNLTVKNKDEKNNIENKSLNNSEEEKPQMILDEFIPKLTKDGLKNPIADIEEFLPNKEIKNEKPQVTELKQTIETLSNLPKSEIAETLKNEIKPQVQQPQTLQMDKAQEFLKPEIAETVMNNVKPQAKIENLNKAQELSKSEITETLKNEIKPQVQQPQTLQMDKAQEFVPQIVETLQNEVKPQVQQPLRPQSNKVENMSTIKSELTSKKEDSNIIPEKNEINIFQENEMLAQLLNEKIDLTQQMPTMEQVIPEQLRPVAKKDAFAKDKFIKDSTGKVEEATPMNNLKTFLSEVLSPEAVQEMQTKDVAIQDDNVMLTDEIKNYYNLNNAKAAAAMDDIQTMLDERVSVLNDISKIISSNNESKEIRKELSSIETKKQEKVETKALKVTEKDATFFNNLIKEANVTEQVSTNTTKNVMEDIKKVQENEKSATVSKALADMIAESSKTNKPFRIDFDKDVSVIIKVDKDGKISADFIPGDKAVEQYLRNSMPLLKQKFADEQIDYKELNYRQSKNQNKERRNKENKNE